MSQELTGFNPLGITVDCENDIFTVTDEKFGTYKAWVVDVNMPLWYGNYEGGKLAIYKARLEGVEATGIPCYGLIFALCNKKDPSMDLAGAVLADVVFSVAVVIGELLTYIHKTLLESVVNNKNEQVSNGSASLH